MAISYIDTYEVSVGIPRCCWHCCRRSSHSLDPLGFSKQTLHKSALICIIVKFSNTGENDGF